MPHSDTDELDRLLREAPFVRSLARQLVHEDPDEVVQQTWLRALERRGQRVDEPRSWLARIVRNVASNLRRGDRRRRRREASRARAAELVPSSSELLEREEHRRAVVAAVDALPPMLRTVVLLRYYDGLPPRRIATLLDVPVATVWTQLRRGHERLRELLDAGSGGDRRAWLLPLVPIALGPPTATPVPVLESASPAATPTLLTATILMTNKAKVLAAIVLTAIVGTCLWWLGTNAPTGAPSGDRSPSPPIAASAPDQPRASPASAPAAADADQRSERTTAVERTVATTGDVLVTLRFGDDHTPAEGYWLTLAPRGRDGRFDGLRARTGAGGVARFEVVPPGNYYVASPNGPGAPAAVAAGETVELAIETEAGLTVNGVVRAPDGSPVAGALVEVTMMAHAGRFPDPYAVTGPDGRFSARACPRLLLLGARARGYASSPLRFVLGENGNEAEVVLTLGHGGGSVVGDVHDPDGRPVAHAVVIVGAGELSGIGGRDHAPPFPALAYTDGLGHFEAIGLPLGEQPVFVRARGFAPWRGTCEVASGGDVHVPVRLANAATVRGVVVDAEGAPARGVELSVGDWDDLAHCRTQSGADGEFVLEGLAAGEVEVHGRHDDLGEATQSMVVEAGAVASCRLQLSRGLELAGRVVDPDGQPVAGAYVMMSSRGWSAFEQSDAQGRFVATNLPADRPIGVRVTARGFAELVRSGLQSTGGEVLLELTRVEAPSVHVSGRVVDPDGRPVANAVVGAQRADGHSSGLFATDNDGMFRRGPLTPGTWSLRVQATGLVTFESGRRELAANAIWDLGTITLIRGGYGVVRVEGESVEGARFYVRAGVDHAASVVTEVDGELRTDALAAGAYELAVAGTGIAHHVVPFSVRDGERTFVDVRVVRGVRQGFRVEADGVGDDTRGASIEVFRGDAFAVRVWCRRADDPGVFVGETWLAPGDYRFEVRLEGRHQSGRVTVAPRPADDVRVRLLR